MNRFRVLWTNLAVVVLAGLLVIPSAPSAWAQPGRPGSRADECRAALSAQGVEPILARYRERFVAARQTMARERRALHDLLEAENTTRAALDAQAARAAEARNAMARVTLDLMWDLRAVVPPQGRERAFRCAMFFLMRRR